MVSILIKRLKLSKFNGELCENLFADIRFITKDMFEDVTSQYNRVSDSIENKNLCRVGYIVVGNIKETYAK